MSLSLFTQRINIHANQTNIYPIDILNVLFKKQKYDLTLIIKQNYKSGDFINQFLFLSVD